MTDNIEDYDFRALIADITPERWTIPEDSAQAGPGTGTGSGRARSPTGALADGRMHIGECAQSAQLANTIILNVSC